MDNKSKKVLAVVGLILAGVILLGLSISDTYNTLIGKGGSILFIFIASLIPTNLFMLGLYVILVLSIRELIKKKK